MTDLRPQDGVVDVGITWDEAKSHLRQSYPIAYEAESEVGLAYDPGDGDVQPVRITATSDDDSAGELLHVSVSSPIGSVEDVDVVAALAHLDGRADGLIGREHGSYVKRYNDYLPEMTTSRLDSMIWLAVYGAIEINWHLEPNPCLDMGRCRPVAVPGLQPDSSTNERCAGCVLV